MSENEAISLAKTGDSFAFTFLYDLHKPNVLRRSLEILKNPDDAEDVTQEVFTQLWQKISQFKGGSSFSTWLYRMVTNRAFDYIRSRRETEEITPEMAVQRPQQHLKLELEQALSSLSIVNRQYVELRAAGYSGKDLGGAYAVNSRIRKAHQQLRRQLA